MRILLLALAACVAGCGPCGRGAPPETAPTAPPVESEPDEAATIEQMIVESQIAGFVRHDLEAYLAPFADTARIVLARGESDDRHATVLTRDQLEASRRMRFSDPPQEGMSMSHEGVRVTIDGDRAELRCRTTVGTARWSEVVEERYRLERGPEGFRIVDNRAWPISRGGGGEQIVYDEETWARLDATAAGAASSGDVDAVAQALVEAFRFREALDAVRTAAAAAPSVEAHLRVAALAMVLGEEAAAIDAYRAIRALEPEHEIPDWVPAD